MEKKALFFDYDGTIADGRTGELPREIPELFARLKAHGCLLFLNTGRTRAILDPRSRALPFDGMILGCGSAVELYGEVLYEYRLNRALCLRTVHALRGCGAEGFLEGPDVLYITDPLTHPRLLEPLAHYRHNRVPILRADQMDRPFSKMFLFLPAPAGRDALRAVLDGKLDWIDRGEDFWELAPSGHSKATGIELVMNHLGLKTENCYAFGDGNNDRPMFERIPSSALIGGGNTELREIVRYISSGVLDGGLTEAVRAFGLVKP